MKSIIIKSVVLIITMQRLMNHIKQKIANIN